MALQATLWQSAHMADKPKPFNQDQVPEPLRQFLADADKNGLPDFMDQLLKNPLLKMLVGKAGERLTSQLRDMKDLTPEQQKKIKALLEKLGPAATTTVTTTSSSVPGVSGSRPAPSTPVIDYRSMGIEDPEQKKSFSWIGLLLGLIAAGAAAWAFLNR